MPATTEAAGRPVRDREHRDCCVCGDRNPNSLGVSFSEDEDGGVSAEFRADPALQGYRGILHGGVIATLLDAAMTHCLFRHGVRGLTGDFRVRYRSSVACGERCVVSARLERARHPVYRLSAEFRCGERLNAEAVASFMSMKEGK